MINAKVRERGVQRVSTRREYLGALAMLVVGGVLGLAVSSRTWGSAEIPSTLTQEVVDVSGNDLVPLASGVSLMALAAVVAVPATRRLGRRIIGGVLLLAGAGLTIAALIPALALDDRIRDWAWSKPVAGDPTATPPLPDVVSTSPHWAFALLLAGLLVWAAGVLVAVRGPSWPALSSRYDRPDPHRGPDDAAPRDTWDALDRGDDPAT